jgi:hypothetical protein
MLFLSVVAIAKKNGLRRETMHFREASSNAVLNGLVQDHEAVDYLLGSRPEVSDHGAPNLRCYRPVYVQEVRCTGRCLASPTPHNRLQIR